MFDDFRNWKSNIIVFSVITIIIIYMISTPIATAIPTRFVRRRWLIVVVLVVVVRVVVVGGGGR